MAVDHYLQSKKPKLQNKFKGEFFELSLEKKIFFHKPQTYMNLSGEAVLEALQFYKLDPATQLVVLHDELDFELGTFKLRLDGGTAGHNGIASIIQILGTDKFMRIRLGIGRPKSEMPVDKYVLQNFSKEEKPLVDKVLGDTVKTIDTILNDGFVKAMNEFNRSEK